MGMEIGSIFEIDPSVACRYGQGFQDAPVLQEVQKYKKKQVIFTASGRAAIALAIKSVAKNNPDVKKVCLLPAYMCDAVFLPFRQENWTIRFYHVNRKLEAGPDELGSLVERYNPGIVFVHPYYGSDTWAPMRELFAEWQSQGAVVIEDVTQSYYLINAGRQADYVVGSLRKWYPVPDGGFVASGHRLLEECVCKNDKFAGQKLDVSVQKWNYLNSMEHSPYKKELYLQKNRELESALDRCCEISAMSGVSAGILAGTDEQSCKKRRQENASILKNGIRFRKSFQPVPYENTGEGAPLYFAVYAKERQKLQKYLAEHGIFAPVLWPVGEENKMCLCEDEAYIFQHLLALPIDQRYGGREMGYLVETVNGYFKSKG